MKDPTIALLPTLPGEHWSWREVAAELAAYNQGVVIVDDLPQTSIHGELDLAGAWVAHCALALAAKRDRPPALLVAYGGAGRMLAALGFAQRASRRRIVGYVIVDGGLPRAGVTDWPDAPVTYIGTRESHMAELRGWEILSGSDLGADIRQVAAQSM